MGGRGGSSGLTSNVVQFPGNRGRAEPASVVNTNNSKWDYRGYVQSVDKIESAVNSAKTRRQVEQAYSGIRSAEQSITAEINRIENGGGDAGDIRVLMTQRRRLRQLRQKLLDKGIL